MACLDSVEVKKAGVEEAARASFGALLGWKSTIRLRPTVHPSATPLSACDISGGSLPKRTSVALC